MASHLKILMMAPSAAIIGGQGVQAARMVEGFRGSPKVSITFQPIDPSLPFGLRKIPGVRTVLSALKLWAQLFWRIPDHDVIHVFTAAYWGFRLWTTPAILIARLYHCPIIVNYRDGQCEDHLRNWRGAVWALRKATVIVTPSGFLAEVVSKFGLKARVIPNLIDLSRFRYRDRTPPKPVFLSNRGLEPLYNIPCILKAFTAIQQVIPEARLIVAHDGPLKAELQTLAASLGLRHVEWRGRVSPSHIPTLYDEAGVYLNSPNIDNMPGSLLECFASGLPIVSTNAGGIPFVAEHERTALLVPVGDHYALAAAALRLFNEPGLSRRLTTTGHDELPRYSPTAVLDAWTACYESLCRHPNVFGTKVFGTKRSRRTKSRT